MRQILFYCLLLVMPMTFAQTHYEEIIRDQNGYIKTIITYNQNDVKDGYTLHYHANGVLKSQIPYQDGKINGYVNHYHSNTLLESSGLIINDLQEGVFEYYHRNGRLKAKMDFLDGKPFQISNCQDKKRNALDCGTLKDGNGYINLFDEKGELIGKDHFKNGELVNREFAN